VIYCKACFDNDGVISAEVVQARVANPVTGAQFDAWVCNRCLSARRKTRATCRTFSN